MNILVLNCGSSSVKFQLFNMGKEEALAEGMVEKIGSTNAIVKYKSKDMKEFKEIQEILTHDQALEWVISTLLHPEHGIIQEKRDIIGVGHRVVHGGERFSGSVFITDEVIKGITECNQFAPLHNPHNLKGIEAVSKKLSHTIQVGVFDTAFHHKMPPSTYIYGIPYALYEKLGIRRYGFHGISHNYVSQKAAEILDTPIEQLRIITCHLGNGCSMAAVKHGNSIDTTMGFTPLEGLLMGTRSGDLDPALIPYVMEKERLTLVEISELMNKYSGLKGISGTTNDMREILEEAQDGSVKHRLALEIFCYRVKKYIGAYAFIMGGVDAIVFTGGIGENAAYVRSLSLSDLESFGIEVEETKNGNNEALISTGKVKVMVIRTNEELVIARETLKTIERLKKRELDTLSTELDKEEKAELVILWATHSRATAEDLARILSQKLNREIDSGSVRQELVSLGLMAR